MGKPFRYKSLALGILLLASQASAQLFPTGGGSALGGDDRPRPLPMEQAFPFFVSIIDDDTLSVTWQIAPEHYLYRHQFGFVLQQQDGAQAQPLEFSLPDGIAKNDQFFGDVEVYYQALTATVKTSVSAGTTLVIQYQGCAEWGFCYPPQASSYPLTP
jgi:thiol:disulfide interchange protein DsbD